MAQSNAAGLLYRKEDPIGFNSPNVALEFLTNLQGFKIRVSLPTRPSALFLQRQIDLARLTVNIDDNARHKLACREILCGI